jgi:hypothetical protein
VKRLVDLFLNRVGWCWLLVIACVVIMGGTITRIAIEEPRFNAADEAGYFAWQQSILTDGDLNPTDELLETYAGGFPSWKWVAGERVLVNKYSTGISQAIVPLTAPTYAVLSITSTQGLTGAEPAMVWAAWVAVALWSCVGLWAMYGALRHAGIESSIAALSVAAAWAGTAAFAHSWKMSLWSHGIGVSIAAIVWYLSIAFLTGRRGVCRILLIGLLVGMALAIRVTNALVLLPICVYVGWRVLKESDGLRTIGRSALVALPMALIPVGIELFTRKHVYGEWLFNGYRFGGEGFFWPPPYVWNVLFHFDTGPIEGGRGIVFAHPVVLVAVAGLIGAMLHRGRRDLACLSLCVAVAFSLLYGAWWFWDLGYSFGARWSADLLPVWALGVGCFVVWTKSLPRRACFFLVPVVAWSLIYCSGGLAGPNAASKPSPYRPMPNVVQAE